jgi:hypothetical protein
MLGKSDKLLEALKAELEKKMEMLKSQQGQ